MIHIQNKVSDVRNWFRVLKKTGVEVPDKTGSNVIEVVGATFIADEPTIFGKLNEDYANREIEWYKSKSLNVNDIPGGVPEAWKAAASRHGAINSNYGWMVWSKSNCYQYQNVLGELKNNPSSRRAVMIYTRPNIWYEYDREGMSDFVCTNTAQYMIRDNKLISIVQMRSNDVIFGYKNDKFWQDYIHSSLATDLGIEIGDMIWHAGSLHVYSKHFHLIEDEK